VAAASLAAICAQGGCAIQLGTEEQLAAVLPQLLQAAASPPFQHNPQVPQATPLHITTAFSRPARLLCFSSVLSNAAFCRLHLLSPPQQFCVRSLAARRSRRHRSQTHA
jgi:hypothetical protein